MSDNSEKRGCRECAGINWHQPHCSLLLRPVLDSERASTVEAGRVCQQHCGHDPELTYKGICRLFAGFYLGKEWFCRHRCNFSPPIETGKAEMHEFIAAQPGSGRCVFNVGGPRQWILCGQPKDAEVHKVASGHCKKCGGCDGDHYLPCVPNQMPVGFCYAEGDEGAQYCGSSEAMHCSVLGDAAFWASNEGQDHLVKCMRDDHFVHHKFISSPTVEPPARVWLDEDSPPDAGIGNYFVEQMLGTKSVEYLAADPLRKALAACESNRMKNRLGETVVLFKADYERLCEVVNGK